MPISMTLDPEAERRLAHLAAETGQSEAFHLEEMIASGLDSLEDYYKGHAVKARIERGEERVLDASEMWRGMDD